MRLETGLQHDDPRFRRAAYLRVGYGTGFALESDVDLRLSVKATSIEVSQDGGTWRALPGERSGAWLAVRLPAGTADGPRFVRWKP